MLVTRGLGPSNHLVTRGFGLLAAGRELVVLVGCVVRQLLLRSTA